MAGVHAAIRGSATAERSVAYWSVALTRRGKIAVWTAPVVPNVYETQGDGGPADIAALAAAGFGQDRPGR